MYTRKVQLPSRGKIGKSHVKLRVPLVDDLRKYLSYTGSHKVAMNALVDSVCNVDIRDYLVGDRDYMMVILRQMVNPSEITGYYECSCDSKEKFTVGYGEIDITQLPGDFKNPAEIRLPISKDVVKLRLLTVGLEDELYEYKELVETSDESIKHDDLGEDLELFIKYALMLDNGESIEDNISYLRGLSYVDFQIIVMFDVTFGVGAKVDKVVECSNCKKKWNIRVPVDEKFLGLSLEGLVNKHRFLAKSMGIGFNDFVNYTNQELDYVVDKQVEYNRKKKKGK